MKADNLVICLNERVSAASLVSAACTLCKPKIFAYIGIKDKTAFELPENITSNDIVFLLCLECKRRAERLSKVLLSDKKVRRSIGDYDNVFEHAKRRFTELSGKEFPYYNWTEVIEETDDEEREEFGNDYKFEELPARGMITFNGNSKVARYDDEIAGTSDEDKDFGL